MTPVVVHETFEVKAPVAEVWPFLADTDRMNRRLGLEGVKYAPLDDKARTPARVSGETTLGGFATRYEERPWEWTWERGLSVRRDFLGGPIASLEVRWTMEPSANGCTLELTLSAVPRAAVLKPVVWWNLRANAAGFGALVREIEAYLAQRVPTNPFANPKTPVSLPVLEQGCAELKRVGVKEGVIEHLQRLLLEGSDADCVKLRPFELADRWGQPRRDVLIGFLQAVPAGLVELRWSLVCPSCRTSAKEVPTLEDISAEGHCNQCDVSFEAELDRAVEASFRPTPAVRKVPDLLFCAAGPARTPHVLVQQNLEARDQGTLLAPAQPGSYTLFARGGHKARLEVDTGGPTTAQLTLGPEGFLPPATTLAPWGSLTVRNETAEPRHVKIERREYASNAVTAHYLSTVGEFRALFSNDLLKRGTPLKVSRVSLLFTDLTGSTALYAEVGDAAAFTFVDQHFEVLRGAIAGAGGTVIKTMGDAVMAAFVDDESCARGAFACLEAFERFRQQTPLARQVSLKVGLHGGPAYMVTANGLLDFFGQTVNVAARLQGLAEAHEVVLQAADYELLSPEARAGRVVSAPFAARVKGVPEPLQLVRVRTG